MAKKPSKSDTSAAKLKTRHAHGTDPEIKAGNLRRMARIEGQVRGIKAMIEDERYCADILQQITAAQKALHAVAGEVLRNHLKHCVQKALTSSPKEAECMQEELLKLFEKRA
ncbi:MAG: metal-sensitive transcriptional regulator [Planctomycetota bacterium]